MSLPLADRATVRAWLWATATARRGAFAGLLGLYAVATAAGLVGPWLLGTLVESVATGATPTDVDRVAAVFLAVLVVQALLRRAAHLRAAVLGERLLASARDELVDHVVRLPLDTVEAAGSGELLGRATADVDKLDEGLRQAAPQVVVAAVTAAATAVAMLLTSPLLALGALVAVPVLVVACRWYRPRAVPTYERTLARWADVHASTHETAEGGRTVQALGLAGRRVAHHDRALRAAAGSEHRGGVLWGRFTAALELSAVLPVVAILLLGGWAHGRGWVGVGELTTMALYAGALTEPVNEMLGWLDEFQVGHAALRRVLGVRESPVEEPAGTRPGPADPLGTALAFRGVEFDYCPGHRVLHGVDLRVAPGERVAVVGPSGAGKSTLGRLLAGVDAPGAGRVEADGVAVTALAVADRRRAVMLVTQEQHVFSGTLRDNLALIDDDPPDPDAPDPDRTLIDALVAVGAGGWLAGLPDGLDTEVGTGGHPVPAATAQRLALARVLLAGPRAVVLDEATSLLGTGPHLAAVLAGRTVVAVTHRLEAAREADRVVVLEGGRVTEQGRHADLLAAGGAYARLWATQQGDPATAGAG